MFQRRPGPNTNHLRPEAARPSIHQSKVSVRIDSSPRRTDTYPLFSLHRNLRHLREPPVRGSRVFSRDRVSFRSLFWKLIFEDAFRSRCIHPMLRRYRSVQLRRGLLRTCFGIYGRKAVFEMRFLSGVVLAFVFVFFLLFLDVLFSLKSNAICHRGSIFAKKRSCACSWTPLESACKTNQKLCGQKHQKPLPV